MFCVRCRVSYIHVIWRVSEYIHSMIHVYSVSDAFDTLHIRAWYLYILCQMPIECILCQIIHVLSDTEYTCILVLHSIGMWHRIYKYHARMWSVSKASDTEYTCILVSHSIGIWHSIYTYSSITFYRHLTQHIPSSFESAEEFWYTAVFHCWPKISHQWSWFDPRELSRSVFNWFALLRSSCLHSTSLISVSGFCPPSFTYGPCNYCSFEFRPRGIILKSIFVGCLRSLFTNPFPAFRASRWLRHVLPLKQPLLTLCKDESYFTLFARYSHVLQWAFCHC